MHKWIEDAAGRTVVLLGAGASQPFVPMSKALTPLVIEYLDQTYSANLPSHQLWRAISPEARKIGDDIEYLYQAVETLGYQDRDPTRYWIEGFRRFGPYDDSVEGRTEFGRDARFLTETIASAAYGIIRERSKPATTEHFETMLRASIAAIVTLNYDTIVENAARSFEVPLSTGAEQWDAGPRWSFPADDLPLLKLHGSVSWRASRVVDPTWQIPRVGLYEVDDPAAAAPNGRIDANLVFGGGNKLRPDGPWPALFAKFEDTLAKADVLVIVGYSFRDAHVDLAIRRWAAGDGNRKVINIDPYPNDTAPMESSFGDLRYALDPDYPLNQQTSLETYWPSMTRHFFVAAGWRPKTIVSETEQTGGPRDCECLRLEGKTSRVSTPWGFASAASRTRAVRSCARRACLSCRATNAIGAHAVVEGSALAPKQVDACGTGGGSRSRETWLRHAAVAREDRASPVSGPLGR